MTLLARDIRSNFKNQILQPTDDVDLSDISIVIPVKNNKKGVNLFLNLFFKTQRMYPREIIIVDNASDIPIYVEDEFVKLGFTLGVDIKVFRCEKEGPASARNLGYRLASGKWILFTDSDCVPTESFLLGYQTDSNGSIAYQGQVKSLGRDSLSKYYESQCILSPLIFRKDGYIFPQYIITANCLVWKKALNAIGGFDEYIKISAGEDVDLGFRLWKIGKLSFANSYVFHNFDDGYIGFAKRFMRYGKGNKILNKIYRLDFSPKPFSPNKRTLYNEIMAKLQYLFLRIGYSARIPKFV